MRCWIALAAWVALGCSLGARAEGKVDDAAWKGIRDGFGRDGHVDGGVLRVTFARDDLKDVMIGGDAVDPGLVYESWFGFLPVGGATGTMMMMGDFCVTEQELPAVQRFIVEKGLGVAAVHNHVINESRRMMFMHVSGHGNAAHLVGIIKAALAKTGTPTDKQEEEKPAGTDWSAAEKVLGKPAEVEGPKVEFVFPRADTIKVHGMTVPSSSGFETADEAAFQRVGGGQAVAYAEFLLRPDEVDATIRVFSAHGFVVQAIHNHMIDDDPHMVFVHAWGKGDLADLAATVKVALQQSDTQFRKTSTAK